MRLVPDHMLDDVQSSAYDDLVAYYGGFLCVSPCLMLSIMEGTDDSGARTSWDFVRYSCDGIHCKISWKQPSSMHC